MATAMERARGELGSAKKPLRSAAGLSVLVERLAAGKNFNYLFGCTIRPHSEPNQVATGSGTARAQVAP
jgi:hypothetical protein